MNKSAIRNFSIYARRKLIEDACYQAGLIGITDRMIAEPRIDGSAERYDIGGGQFHTIHEPEIAQRRALANEIRRRARDVGHAAAYRYVMEEAAYTWFNRLIAIRFLEINGYLPSNTRVLSSESGKQEPDLVAAPFDAGLELDGAEMALITRLKDSGRVMDSDALFRFLFRKQCNVLNGILPGLFDRTDSPGSYEELLLNISWHDPDGVVRHLVDEITEDNFDIQRGGQVEIIGWLYQYYNTEPKNEAFAKSGKITKEEIPAVTQLFTPDWIVRYMVQNSLGRLWAEGRPESGLRAEWQYYLDEAPQEAEVSAKLAEIRRGYAGINPEEIRLLDPCMGSGHILVYAFDVLIQIYADAGWNRRDAVQSIVKNNLYGLDIDKRAYQLAYFALMMKAREYDRRFLTRGIGPNVYYIVQSNDIMDFPMEDFGWTMPETEQKKAKSQIATLFAEMKDACEIGSLAKVSPCDWKLLETFTAAGAPWRDTDPYALNYEGVYEKIKELFKVAIPLSQRYDVVVTNPPYMGGANMNGKLAEYVKRNYADSKADLFAVFIERCLQLAKENRYVAMITQHSWMFLSSFEKLRVKLRVVDTINMAHLGPRAFEEIGGEVVQTTSFVMRRSHIADYAGTYCRLIEPKSEAGKKDMFLKGENRYITPQSIFIKIPGAPVAYWASSLMVQHYEKQALIKTIASPRAGLATGDNNRFQRMWFEIIFSNIGFNVTDISETTQRVETWYPCNSGGLYRKWSTDNIYVVNWKNNGYAIRNFKNHTGRIASRPQNTQMYFKEGLTWNKLSSLNFAVKYKKAGFIFDDTSRSAFVKENDILFYLIGLLCSCVTFSYLKMLNPTLSFTNGDLERIPCCFNPLYQKRVDTLVKENIRLSRVDWDSFETSWDFAHHPLLPKREEQNDGG